MDTVPDRSRVGPFVLEAPLGGGSSGSLHRAVDPRRGRVALRWAGSGDPLDLADEAAALTACVHPHVVALHEAGESDGRAWLALALVEGPDLRTVLGGRPMPAGRAAVVLTQLAAAVDAVHAAGFVHLDLKPANVLVAAGPGGGDHVVLADFGLARRYGVPERAGSDFVGSPAYAAPEHLRGDPVGPRADVYALTCLAVACLTGRPPYPGGVAAVVAAHRAGVVPPSGLGPHVDAVVRRGMAADPADRFASAGGLVHALCRALGVAAAPVGDGEVVAPPASGLPRRVRDPLPPTSGRWAQRGAPVPPRVVVGMLVGVLVIVAAVVVGIVLAVP